MIIIIVLKVDWGVNLEQGHDYGLRGSTEVDQVNVKIKVVIIVVLKPNSRINWSKAQVTS
jgi:hypothetical protein